MMQNITLRLKRIKCHSRYDSLTSVIQIDSLSTTTIKHDNNLTDDKKFTDTLNTQNLEQIGKSNAYQNKNEIPKRINKVKVLTEEQIAKRREFFLQEEEWERKVDVSRLTNKGCIQKQQM